MNYYIKHPKDKDKWLGVGKVHSSYYYQGKESKEKIKNILRQERGSNDELIKKLKVFVEKFDFMVESHNNFVLVIGAGANRLDYGSSVSSSDLEKIVKNCAYAKEAMNDMKDFLSFCKKNVEQAEAFAKLFYDKKNNYNNHDFDEYEQTHKIEKLISFIRQKVFYIDLPTLAYSMPDSVSDWDLVEDNPGARFVQKTCYAVFTGSGKTDSGFLVNKLKMGGSISDAVLFDSELLAQRAGKKVATSFSVVEVQVSIQGIKQIHGHYQNDALDGAMTIYEKERIEKFFEQNDIEKLKLQLAEYEEKLKSHEANNQAVKSEEKVVRRKI
jgi:hypothetical protein